MPIGNHPRLATAGHLRQCAGMQTKLSKLKAAAAAGDWRGALSIAARFPRLGAEGPDIKRAHEAMHHPHLYAQLGRDPDALVADGIAALRRRYNLNGGTMAIAAAKTKKPATKSAPATEGNARQRQSKPTGAMMAAPAARGTRGPAPVASDAPKGAGNAFTMDPGAFKSGWKQEKGIQRQTHKGWLVEIGRDPSLNKGPWWAKLTAPNGGTFGGYGETFRRAVKDAAAKT